MWQFEFEDAGHTSTATLLWDWEHMAVAAKEDLELLLTFDEGNQAGQKSMQKVLNELEKPQFSSHMKQSKRPLIQEIRSTPEMGQN
ncbi:unnamed protein product [Darwinula stevensoni]|uniref:Uncharacterized protein n=1 Tax=Darwinula stevensoni TaxID=69355 RepID=A0A7R8X142_9CRUS|nr:unnamed protein product [Darwinula stevensoni]CAG0881870.1 unnamed protein product [Darwinula stevensoni]